MAWRAAISWMGISPRPWWRARSSTALIAYSPLAEIRMAAGVAALAVTPVLQQPRRLPREVGDDDVGPGPADGGQGLHHGPPLVEPAEPPGRLDHRVLAGDRVGGQGHPELGLGPGDDVQVGQRRL